MNKKIVVCISILSLYTISTFAMNDQLKLKQILSAYKRSFGGLKYINLAREIRSFTGDINTKLSNGSTLLIELSQDPDKLAATVIEPLLEKGADPALSDNKGNNALFYAENATPQNKEVITLLQAAMKRTKPQPIPTQTGPTEQQLQDFVVAAGKHYMKTVKSFLAQFPNNINDFAPTKIAGLQLNALMAAAQVKGIDEVKELLKPEYTADVNIQNTPEGYTALMLATLNPGNREVIKALLDVRNIDVNIADNNGRTAFMYAILNDNRDSIAALKEKGANVNAWDKQNKTILDLVNESRMPDKDALIRGLKALAPDAKTYAELQAQPTPITPPAQAITQQDFVQAAYDGDLATVRTFLAKPENLTHINDLAQIKEKGTAPVQDNALSAAVEEEKEDVLHELLKYKELNINQQDPLKNTALHTAVIKNNQSIIKTLLDAKADPNIQGANGMTPLMRAVQQNNINSVNTLLQYPQDLNLKSHKNHPKTWETALWIAINKTRPNTDIIKALLAKGADINIKNNQGKTPLQVAAERNLTEIAQLLQQKTPITPITPPTAPDLGMVYQQLMQLNSTLKTLQQTLQPSFR